MKEKDYIYYEDYEDGAKLHKVFTTLFRCFIVSRLSLCSTLVSCCAFVLISVQYRVDSADHGFYVSIKSKDSTGYVATL